MPMQTGRDRPPRQTVLVWRGRVQSEVPAGLPVRDRFTPVAEKGLDR
jgi:hypothetical protein